ncbi:MAG: exosortase/archaeosortase family protein [Verrucomicrobiae bacterium]|nr:exosortase/archaeosortase family protein [Verrucomicrobiae bacterium]
MPLRLGPWWRLTLWLVPLGWLWLVLVNHLRIEWTVNAQYGYGWAVPLLAAYLFWQRAESVKRRAGSPAGERPGPAAQPSGITSLAMVAFVLGAVLYAPTRLIEEANPEWRLVSWALALIVISLTLLALPAMLRDTPLTGCAWHFAFPVCFVLVAVPWPTMVEGPLIQTLTRANATVTIELLSLIGIPAVQHGNVIEISTGVVGIDEACSGIRSFQAALMLSLFLGEMYRLSVLRRLVLCLVGFGLSFFFNVGRTGLLTWVASRDGVEAIDKWHDPAGVTILVGCFVGLWLAGLGLRKPQRTAGGKEMEDGGSQSIQPSTPRLELAQPALRIPLALLIWLVMVEVGVEAWYRSYERSIAQAPQWTIAWPDHESDFTDLPFAEKTRQFLRYDEGRNAVWNEPEGRRWQVIFLRWNPGRIATHLAKGHTPETCLTAAGHELLSISDLEIFEVRGLALPFRHYQLESAGRRLHVYYCLWEDRGDAQGFEVTSLTYGSRLEPVWSGRRNLGQRSLELAVWGIDDAAEASAALRAQLEKLIVVEETMDGG